MRYEGTDEAYAVNELYMKMKERVAEQKAHQSTSSAPKRSNTPNTGGKYPKKKSSIGKTLFWLFCFMCIAPAVGTMILAFVLDSNTPGRGYYDYNGTPYYYSNDWYEWSGDSWIEAPYSSWMDHDYADYYDSYGYDSGADYDNFADSPYYSTESDTSWDNGDDWNDSWDDDWGNDDSWNDSWDDWDSDW